MEHRILCFEVDVCYGKLLSKNALSNSAFLIFLNNFDSIYNLKQQQ